MAARAAAQPSRTPRLKRALCVKYVTFLSYAKTIRLKGPWNRYYGCLFRTAGPAVTSMRGLLGTVVMPHGGGELPRKKELPFAKPPRKKELLFDKPPRNKELLFAKLPRNKELLFAKLLSHMLSKPVKIASFDFDGTLINPTGEKHPNSVLVSTEAIHSITVLKKIHQYNIVIFSNQTCVSSPLYDSTHVEQNKLPILFSKMQQLTDALRYFYALYESQLGGQLNGVGYPSIKRRRGRRVPPDDTPIGPTHKNNCSVSAFFAVGKGNIEALDIYPKPSEGQYCLFICLEGIKYALIIMSYFAKGYGSLLEREIMKQKDKPLGEFLRVVVDMFSNPYLCALVKRLRRGVFHLNKESFYAGDNVGRDFDKSDVDSQFAARARMRLLDDGQARQFGGPKQ
ncbi:hypothetical protein PCYB_052430 [Plasmodium cynomolgi strain B]|uniref:Phosphatase n=1 Tax=Plasmodium cynomolgi (strain B) TaxID=1120755 RepID=K6UT48_PLACD|nr:hypothetical protein PCYB_052430 [Plasmodium cynomolgi strain B]GAB65225.1 hypothetical protein PCYB_052430 [Plasmodium cynomolgi strain B]